MCRIFLCIFVLFDFSFSTLENAHKRHEYQLTFKGPTITPPNSNEIPFFDVGGHVVTGKDRIRLTASLPSQQGWIWSKSNASFDGFQVDLVFRISGVGRVGADGLALWVTQSRSVGGPAIGAGAVFHGLGILFDSIDLVGHRRNPMVLGVVNDGTKLYKVDNDGKDVSVGHCIREYRNTPHPILCRVTYFQKLLVVSLTTGYAPYENGEIEECFRANIELPKAEYYFGLSSSTGTLADDHDVEKMEVHSITELANVVAEDEKRKQEEQKKYEEDYQHKMDNIAKTEPVQEAPKEDIGEKGISQNLMAIWHEIAGQHNSINTLIKTLGSMPGGLSGDEKNTMTSNFDSLSKGIVEIKNSVELVSRKMENSGNTYQNQQAFTQIHSSMDSLKTDILRVSERLEIVLQRVNQIKDNEGVKPDTEGCGGSVSLPLMVILGTLQSAFVIGFLIYQKNRDNAAKKFY